MRTALIVKDAPHLVVGSAALNLRYAKDIDVVIHSSHLPEGTVGDEYLRSGTYNGKKHEFLLTDNQDSLAELLKRNQEGIITQLEACYIVKAGHIHIAGRSQENWEKHMHDYRILKWYLMIDDDQEAPIWFENLIKLHRRCTDERVKQKTPRLKGVSKDDFFDDNVVKYYVHDDIHKAIAFRDKPAYEYMQKDETVECHKDLWDKFDYDQKLEAVLEECYTIALERQIIPSLRGMKIGRPKFLAFRWALYRVCTNLTSGWFRRFAIENYFTILNRYDEAKIGYALTKLEKIKPLTQTT